MPVALWLVLRPKVIGGCRGGIFLYAAVKYAAVNRAAEWRFALNLINSPDPQIRNAIVRQDLASVLHPIVHHRALEQQQMVIVGGQGSTIVDADGTSYLDAMAGLWCVNIGYGRTELAAVAAEQMQALAYYPHTAMNAPAAALASTIGGLMGGG